MKNPTRPIEIPRNPFWEVFRTFGRDELVAGIFSIIATMLVGNLLLHITVSAGTAVLMLAFAGPIFEKFGFFVGHVKEAYEVYSTTPIEDRKGFRFYTCKAIRGGTKSLIQDILVHDPIYIVLMIWGISIHPGTPAWLLVPIAFGIAVLIVAVLEVSFNEFCYIMRKRSLYRQGFVLEQYYEARFFLGGEEDPENVLEQLRDQFLSTDTDIYTLQYLDRYYPTKLSGYNARTPKLRIRTRCLGKEDKSIRTLQVIYTRAVEHPTENDEQFRFFPTRKDKLYRILKIDPRKDDYSERFPGIDNIALQNFLGGLVAAEGHEEISFIRRVSSDPKKLFLSVDTVERDDEIFHVVEIKAYLAGSHLLKEAMRYIMLHFNVLQTTRSKSDLLKLD